MLFSRSVLLSKQPQFYPFSYLMSSVGVPKVKGRPPYRSSEFGLEIIYIISERLVLSKAGDREGLYFHTVTPNTNTIVPGKVCTL